MHTRRNQAIVVSLFVLFGLPVLLCSAAQSVSFVAGTSAGWDYHELAGDIARNNTVDLSDLNVIAQHWLTGGCADANQWCGGADIDASTGVDFLDYAILANNWGKIAGQSVLLQTIYGSAQDSSGNIIANTARALMTDKGMAMAFQVPSDTALDKGIFKVLSVNVDNTLKAQVRLYNVTGKGYLNSGHTMTKADPGAGAVAIFTVSVPGGSTVPYHLEGTTKVTDLFIDFGPLEITAGEYLLVFDNIATRSATVCSMVKGTGTFPDLMGKYPDGTPLPKRATVTSGSVTGSTYYYYLNTTSSTSYTSASDLFAFQITTTIVNHVPQVNAGTDQTVQYPNAANLAGTASDDGNPNPPGVLSTTWSKTSGPGDVTFGDASALNTIATFSDFGTYVLRLTANDSVLSAYDEVTITYRQNQQPVVNAGVDQTVGNIDLTDLDGTVTDDGLPNPPGAVTTQWTKQSGPGTVTFGNASAVDTSVSFSATGVYVLRLTANDSEFSPYDEVTITVVEGSVNSEPVVDAGSDKTITEPTNSVSLDATVTDDGKPNPPGQVTITWTQQSGPGTVTFGNIHNVDTTATFSEFGTYVLRLTATDGALSSYDELTVTFSPYVYEGYAPLATGGEGGSVVWVTNTLSSGSGSFTDAVSGLTGAPTIIKFAVGGTISFGGEIRIEHSNVTVAGETAPAPGITFTGGGRLGIKADNVIIRHIRSRNADAEGIQIWTGNRVIIDHCSISGCGDGAIDMNEGVGITISRCLFAYCVEVHKAHCQRVSAHHSLYTYNNRRQPRVFEGGPMWDFRNNVVEYWTGTGGNILSSVGVNIINNIYNPVGPGGFLELALVITGTTDPNTVYTNGNYCPGVDINALGLATVPNEEPNVITTDILADPEAFRDSIRRDCGAMPRDSIDTGYAGPAGP